MRAVAFLLVATVLLAGCSLPEVPKEPGASVDPTTTPTPSVATPTPSPAGPEQPRRLSAFASYDEAAKRLVVVMRVDGDRGAPLVVAGATTITWSDSRGKELSRVAVDTLETDFTTQERRGEYFPGVVLATLLSAMERSDGWQGSDLTASVTHVTLDGRTLRTSARVPLPDALLDQTPNSHSIDFLYDSDTRVFTLRSFLMRDGRTLRPDGEGILKVEDSTNAVLLEERWTFRGDQSRARDPYGYREVSVEKKFPVSSFRTTEAAGGLRVTFTAILDTGETNATTISRDSSALAPALADRARLTIIQVTPGDNGPEVTLRFENIGTSSLAFCGGCFTAKTSEGLVYSTSSWGAQHPSALEPGARYTWRETVNAPSNARIAEVVYKPWDSRSELRASAP